MSSIPTARAHISDNITHANRVISAKYLHQTIALPEQKRYKYDFLIYQNGKKPCRGVEQSGSSSGS